MTRAQGWTGRSVPEPWSTFRYDPRVPWEAPWTQDVPPRVQRGMRRWQARQRWAFRFQRVAERLSKQHLVPVNFPPSADLAPRYGYGKPPHPQLLEIVAAGSSAYSSVLADMAALGADLLRIDLRPGDPSQPAWVQAWLPPLDGATIYTLLRTRQPGRYLEVGSGWSTRFAARAKADGGLATEVVSIDPEPRVEVDALCDRVIRSGLEQADLSVFRELSPGDVVFIDNSHRVFTNSDVTVAFMDILPTLPDGVVVGFHDMPLPEDYPPGWTAFHFSELYVLAAYLLAGCSWLEPLFAAHYVASDEELLVQGGALVEHLRAHDAHVFGSGFWMTVRR